MGLVGGKLAVEAHDGGGNEGLAGEMAGVVGEVAGGEVVGAVGDQVVARDEVEGVVRREAQAVRLHLHLGIDLGKRSEENTSELQSLMRISYAVFCLKKTKQNQIT